jgi:hypothetical protein
MNVKHPCTHSDIQSSILGRIMHFLIIIGLIVEIRNMSLCLRIHGALQDAHSNSELIVGLVCLSLGLLLSYLWCNNVVVLYQRIQA